MDDEKKTYIAIIRIGGEPGELMAKVRIAAPAVLKNIERISSGEFQLAFTTRDGTSFAYLLRTHKMVGVIRALICGNAEIEDGPAALRADDTILILEVGETYDGLGFSRAWTWLQHHHSVT